MGEQGKTKDKGGLRDLMVKVKVFAELEELAG